MSTPLRAALWPTSPRKMVRLLGVVLVACVLAGCGHLPSPRTPFPLPANAMALELHTTPPAEQPLAGNWACPGALLAPVQVVRDGDAVVFQLNGQRVDLVWPRGFSARLLDGQAQIVAPDGSVGALAGEVIEDYLGGDASAICSVGNVIYGPAT